MAGGGDEDDFQNDSYSGGVGDVERIGDGGACESCLDSPDSGRAPS